MNRPDVTVLGGRGDPGPAGDLPMPHVAGSLVPPQNVPDGVSMNTISGSNSLMLQTGCSHSYDLTYHFTYEWQ